MTPAIKTSGSLSVALRVASEALACVRGGQALDEALLMIGPGLSAPDRAAAQDIAYTACRRFNLLDALAAALMKKPNPPVDFLLRAALSELIAHPARAHTIVDQAVTAASDIANGAFKPLVNGVLRSFLRDHDAQLTQANSTEAIRLGYPQWWIDRVRAAWPAHWEALLDAGNQRAPMTLRANLKRGTVEQLQSVLTAAGIAAHRTGESAVTLDKPQAAARIPGFAEGRVSVQDLGAQQAAQLLGTETGMRVLDACAAPGGKTAHILERTDCNLTALDRDVTRLDTVRANLLRLGLVASCRAADAAKLDTWWDGARFDRVLLDAPCTASGVIARHPDGKWLKRARDIAQLARLQAQLLAALWQVLKPGGKLLYATCSVFPEENTRQIDAFVSAHPDARLLSPSFDTAYPLLCLGGQLLPSPHHGGFYYALLEKH